MKLLMGLGYSETVIRNSNYRFIYLGQVSGILPNTTYDIRVKAKVGGAYSTYGALCQVTTPGGDLSTQLTSSDCGITLSSYSEYVICDYLAGATEYEYEITNGGLSFSQTMVRPSSHRFLYLNQVIGIQDGVTYDIKVRANVGGSYTSYGNACQVTTPAGGLTTKLRDADCGSTLVDSATFITCDYVPGATQYEYEIVNSSLSYSQTVVRPSNYKFIYLSSVSGVLYNTTYDIRVRAYVSGSWINYGTMCQVTTSISAGAVGGGATARIINGENEPNGEEQTELMIYPNPNQGEYMFVELTSLAQNSELIVTDISGKQIQREKLMTEDSNYKTTIKFDQKLESGFYLVTIVSNGKPVTKKLIVR